MLDLLNIFSLLFFIALYYILWISVLSSFYRAMKTIFFFYYHPKSVHGPVNGDGAREGFLALVLCLVDRCSEVSPHLQLVSTHMALVFHDLTQLNLIGSLDF